jgi:beta-mannosidase
VRTLALGEKQAKLGVTVEVCAARAGEAPCEVRVAVRGCGFDAPPCGGSAAVRPLAGMVLADLDVVVPEPRLWWPVGLGGQPLYEAEIQLMRGGHTLDRLTVPFGIRTVERRAGKMQRTSYEAKEWVFHVNGKPLFIKGSNWMPIDVLANVSPDEYAWQVGLARDAGVQMLRVWGGGVYENDAFYDLCDEYGICVWQDMMLDDEQAAEPSAARLAAFESEVRQNVQRLRHHPSLVLWCEGSGGAAPAYGKTAARQVEAFDPDGVCLPAMPHVPFSLDGDAGYEPMPSYPEPRAVAEYVGEEERNVSHPVCAYHTTPPDGAKRIFGSFLDQFLMPSGFENTTWLSQVQQGFALKQQFERVRMGERPPAGFLYWHLNDSWPVCSPSSVDHEGRWKAAHFMLRRFFASIWLCGGYRPETGCVDIHTFNDGVKSFKGELQWRLTQMEGSVVAEGSKKVAMQPASRERPACVKAAEALRKFGAGNLLLWLYLLDEQGNQVAWNFALLCAPRELALQPPRMRAEIRSWDDNSFAVTLTSHRPAMWVWITLEGMEARYDDNFFCLEPEKSVRVRVTPSSRIKLDQFRQIIRIGSLRDTWQEKRSLMQMMAAAKK